MTRSRNTYQDFTFLNALEIEDITKRDSQNIRIKQESRGERRKVCHSCPPSYSSLDVSQEFVNSTVPSH